MSELSPPTHVIHRSFDSPISNTPTKDDFNGMFNIEGRIKQAYELHIYEPKQKKTLFKVLSLCQGLAIR